MLLALACAHHPVADRPLPDLVRDALPGVVLLVRGNPDGSLGYGAGILADEHGGIVTNLHVVANASSLGVLFHDPNRTSYTPDDGGLARFLFEQRGQLVPASLIRADAVTDLALVRADADTSAWARLPLRESPVLLGEEVLALGHPQETVWSFSTGVVSALHQGMIQTDAAINRGNSGGPLLDRQGRVIGVSTTKLLGGTDNIAFARPIALARPLLDPERLATVDRSSAERAFSSCHRALELGSTPPAACIRWESLRAAAVSGVEAGMRERGDPDEVIAEALAKLRADRALEPEALAGMVGAEESVDARLLTSVYGGLRIEAVAPPVVADASFLPADPPLDEILLDIHNLRLDVRNPTALLETLKLGCRIEGSHPTRSDGTWLDVRGRNTDGSEYRYAQLMIETDAGWVLDLAPTLAAVSRLPEGWIGPLSTFDTIRVAFAKSVLSLR